MTFQKLFEGTWAFVLLGFGPFALIYFFPNGLGGGDIKMLAGMAIWNGVMNTFLLLIGANFLALCTVLLLKITKKIDWDWKIPFGVFMAISNFVFIINPDCFNSLRKLL